MIRGLVEGQAPPPLRPGHPSLVKASGDLVELGGQGGAGKGANIQKLVCLGTCKTLG